MSTVATERSRTAGESRNEQGDDKFVSVVLQASGRGRKETFLGRQFRVIPAVMVKSQVLHNNLGVTFLPPGDITDAWADLWNGIPVLVGPHPSMRGQPCSGRDATLWNERLGGWIFQAKAKQAADNTRQLSGEVWLDESRAEAVEGLTAVLERLDAGEPVELSTGFPVQAVQAQGSFQGSAYEIVMHPQGADHLLISTEMTGACSVVDGCGLGVNKFEGEPPVATNDETPTTQPVSLWDRIKARLKDERTAAENSIEAKYALDEHARALNGELPSSDQERANKIRESLQASYGSRGEVIVCDVFSESKQVVFWLVTPLGSAPQGSEYFRANFTEGEDGAYTFGEPERVYRKTVYEPVGNATTTSGGAPATQTAANACQPCASQEEATMSKENENTQGTGAGTPTLEQQVASIAQSVQSLAQTVNGLVEAAKTDPNPAIAGLKQTMAEFSTELKAMKSVTQSAVQERDRERQDLVRKLSGNFRVPFTPAELEAKPLDELRKIAQMAGVEDYAARGGPRTASNSDREQAFMEPVPYFGDKKEGGK